jgi:hypothetical protein
MICKTRSSASIASVNPRRLEMSAVEAGASGADEMNARQPVPGNDLRKRRLALHEFGKAGRNRIDRHRGNRRRGCHEINDHDFRLLRHQPRQRQRGQRDALTRCRTQHGHLARRGVSANQHIRHLLDFTGFQPGIHSRGHLSRAQ